MFNVGFSEICLIVIIALIVIGPRRLPEVSHQVGRWIKYFRNLFKAVSTEVNEHIEDTKSHDDHVK